MTTRRPHPIDTFLLLIIAIAVALLVGCATTTADAPKTPKELIAHGYVAVDTLASSLRVAKRDGYITAERRDQLADQLDVALNALEAADDTLRGKDPASDEVTARIVQAQAILRAVETTLKGLQK